MAAQSALKDRVVEGSEMLALQARLKPIRDSFSFKSPAFRRMIRSAMGLSSGHWLECPNGHIYAIGDCGGAREQGRCPECKSVIGGANYGLAPGNRLSDFDGATAPAWDQPGMRRGR